MATNKFLIFDEAGQDLMTDAEYQSASQRVSGVVPGLADSSMHNKLYRQVSIMAAAIGKVLAESNLDAPDDSLNTLASNIKELFISKPLDAYPVGAIYISASAVSPETLFGGTWSQIQGKFLLAANATYAAGTTGGESAHVLKTNEIPSHTHAPTLASNGSHNHSVTIASNGSHKHGFSEPLDEFGFDVTGGGQGPRIRGAMGDNYPYAGNVVNTESKMNNAGEHSHTATVSNAGEHSHTITIASVGGNSAHNNMPPYLAVYVWQRTA